MPKMMTIYPPIAYISYAYMNARCAVLYKYSQMRKAVFFQPIYVNNFCPDLP